MMKLLFDFYLYVTTFQKYLKIVHAPHNKYVTGLSSFPIFRLKSNFQVKYVKNAFLLSLILKQKFCLKSNSGFLMWINVYLNKILQLLLWTPFCFRKYQIIGKIQPKFFFGMWQGAIYPETPAYCVPFAMVCTSLFLKYFNYDTK